jgi:hypothetical protein
MYTHVDDIRAQRGDLNPLPGGSYFEGSVYSPRGPSCLVELERLRLGEVSRRTDDGGYCVLTEEAYLDNVALLCSRFECVW